HATGAFGPPLFRSRHRDAGIVERVGVSRPAAERVAQQLSVAFKRIARMRAAMSLFPRPSAARDGGRRAHRDVLAACLGKRLIAARILAMRLNATLSRCATRSAAGFADA